MMNVTDPTLPAPRFTGRQWPVLATWVLCLLTLVISGCATWQQPDSFDVSVLRARAEFESLNNVTLSAAVLSSEDSQQMFGANVNETGVQPVWIEIENNTNQALWLLRSGTDPDLYSPLEVAWSFHKFYYRETNGRIDAHFDALSFQNPILPGETKSGILFTNPHRKTRLLSIDILGQGQLFPLTLFPLVPDDETGEKELVKIMRLIAAVTTDYQDADLFRAELERLPCCASGPDGRLAGDPLNVVLIGNIEDIATALIRRGFRTDRRALDNVQRLFDRPPDFVARKAGQSHAPANWLRIWVAPMRYQGKSVFLVQAGRPLGFRRDRDDDEEVLVLNPNVDEVRNLLIQDLLYSGGLQKLAFVTGAGATRPEEPGDSPGGEGYHTDGLRAVLFLITRPLSLSDLEILDWHPYMEQRVNNAVQDSVNERD